MALICDLNISLNCDSCFETAKAYGNLTFPVGLAPTNTYYLFVIDRFGNVYRQIVTIAGDGSFTIDSAGDPSGLYEGSSGESLQLFLSSDINGSNFVLLTINATSYNCIMFAVLSCNTNFLLTESVLTDILETEYGDPILIT